MSTRGFVLLLSLVITGGCAIYASDNWDEVFGPAEPRQRMASADSEAAAMYLDQVQPILEQRCVVCHGCYDSPCQLNMASPEGIDRGASKDKVYRGGRLSEAAPSRLFEDAKTTAEWRDKGFYPVLNERRQTPNANLRASVMHNLLELKREHPLPDQAILPDNFDFGLNRKQVCPKPDEIDSFAAKNPLWGMPFGLPGLSSDNFNTLERWLEDGAAMALPPKYSAATQVEIDRWEEFLNGDSLKQQLMSRYLYEHWFLAHLYFSELAEGDFFRIVRSSTPPGQAIEQLATRRPYDDPGVERVYYRFWRDHSTILDKTHMPYALDGNRLTWLTELFLELDYPVEQLPSYEPKFASNPFITFSAIPAESRWRFLRAEGQFTVMNFIKGPVCRGQTALSVIRDNFWVFFDSDQLTELYPEEAQLFLLQQETNLSMPAAEGSDAGIISTWNKYSKLEQAYLKAKSETMSELVKDGGSINLDLVWDGDGNNQNAALTVFRHFDSASVVRGLVGPEPQTAWVIDYPILERIHYLLVAGYDVFGNAGHQLNTRLYMDFLRMEGEFNFLSMLPPETRMKESRDWYKGASKRQQSYVYGSRANFKQPSDIVYQTDNPKKELFAMLREKLSPVLNHVYDLDQAAVPESHREALQDLQKVRGLTLSSLPHVVFLDVVTQGGESFYYTILRNVAHQNVTSLFKESSNLTPENDTLTVVKDFIGSYPSAYWRVAEAELPALVEQVSSLSDDASYAALMARYGVRRSAPNFWQHSDKVIAAHHRANPLENGLLDYNRLENR